MKPMRFSIAIPRSSRSATALLLLMTGEAKALGEVGFTTAETVLTLGVAAIGVGSTFIFWMMREVVKLNRETATALALVVKGDSGSGEHEPRPPMSTGNGGRATPFDVFKQLTQVVEPEIRKVETHTKDGMKLLRDIREQIVVMNGEISELREVIEQLNEVSNQKRVEDLHRKIDRVADNCRTARGESHDTDRGC